MAYALNFDGVNDYLTFPVWTAPNDFRLVLPAEISGGGGRVWFYDSANYASHNMDIGRTSSNGLIVDIGGEKSQWNAFYVADTDIHEITIERVSGFISVYIDGVQFGSSLPSTNTLTLNTYGKGDWGGYASAMELEGFELTDLTTPSNSRLYSASASDHGAGNPTLVDTLGGFDASGVGMPTDGSAWINLGGNPTPVDLLFTGTSRQPIADKLTLESISQLGIAGTSRQPTADAFAIVNISELTLSGSTRQPSADTVDLSTISIIESLDNTRQPTSDTINLSSIGELVFSGNTRQPSADTITPDNVSVAPIRGTLRQPTVDTLSIELYTELSFASNLVQISADTITLTSKTLPQFGKNDILMIDNSVDYLLTDNSIEYKAK